MKKKPMNTTKLKIIRTATKLFLENGYSNTSVRGICSELGIGLGHMTFYFPTKEHLLAELTTMLCDFQWKLMKEEADEGCSLLLAVCLEVMTMASMADENKVVRDFFVSSYTSALTLEIMRRNDTERSKIVYAGYCAGWSDEQFHEAETLVSGIEYATLMITETSAPLETRISGALKAIMRIYNVPEETINEKLHKVLSMDYRGLGRKVFKEFKEYVENTTEEAFEEMMKA